MSVDLRSGPTARRSKPYPEYKDSGVEWLGEIPAARSVRRLTVSTLWSSRAGGLPPRKA
jgi:hypothetical protein